ncbi:MAG: spherulation-specific family 4 protein [Candidatus Paceibacterota bacterium]|jgi:hypothetical protein
MVYYSVHERIRSTEKICCYRNSYFGIFFFFLLFFLANNLASAELATAKVALPLYIYPSNGETNWTKAHTFGQKIDFIIANVYNGPSGEVNSDWTNMIEATIQNHIKVYGYVYTSYGARAGSKVDEDVARWLQLYPQISGIFLDETASSSDKIPYYKARYDYIKRLNSSLRVVINPGTVTDEGYMNVSDVNTIFESNLSSWNNAHFPEWVLKYPASRFYSIIYGVSSEEEMKNVARVAREKNFGEVFITDAFSPSDRLPTYFSSEISEITSVTTPIIPPVVPPIVIPPVDPVIPPINNEQTSNPPSPDLCSNISGIQLSIPSSMNIVNLECVIQDVGNNVSEDISDTTTFSENRTVVKITPAPIPIEECYDGSQYNRSTGALCANNNPVYNFGSTILKNGSKGEAIKELQRFLNAKLNLGLVLDGKFGPKTTVVVKKWQRENGLVADGIIGPKTKAKMETDL